VGTSAGALDAVFVAAHGMSPTSMDLLAATWAGLRREDVFPLRAPQVMLALARARDALEFAAEAAMREAEIAVVQHCATEDQQRRVRAMAAVHTHDAGVARGWQWTPQQRARTGRTSATHRVPSQIGSEGLPSATKL
jgi:hypothetical protein